MGRETFSVLTPPPSLRTSYVFALVLLVAPLSLFGQTPSSVSFEQPNVTLELGGTAQPRFSYGSALDNDSTRRERLGFSVRRARLRFRATVAERTGVYFQMGGAGASAELLDAVGFYRITEDLTARIGRFTSAQPRSFQGTSHTRIDAVSRAAVAQLWGENTIGSGGRDFGLDLRYETKRAEATLAVQNGDGNWSRARGNYRADVAGGNPAGGEDDAGLAVGAYGAYRPAAVSGLEVGGYVGYNADENPNTELFGRGRSYASYAGHLYWGARPGSQPVRLKFDLIGIRYEEIRVLPPTRGRLPVDQHTLGGSFLAAVRPHRAGELFARFEQYAPYLDGDRDLYVTAGGSFSLSALRGRPYRQERLTLAYGAFGEDGSFEDAPQLVVLQAQVLF